MPWNNTSSETDLKNITFRGPFTESLFFNNMDSFITGLKIETWYKNSSECFTPIWHQIDDWYYFQLNLTNINSTGFGIVLNGTNSVSKNLANIFPSCAKFGESLYYDTIAGLEAFNYSAGNITLAFVLNAVAKAPAIPNIFE